MATPFRAHWKVKTLNLAKAGGGGLHGIPGARPAELQTLKETDLLTPRGGFFDARNQNRDPEPYAKTVRDFD